MSVKVSKSKIPGAGKGLFTTKPFAKGELIGLAHKDGQPVGNIGKMHNHSEEPTAYSVKLGNKRFVYANRDLDKGEEITTDYRMQPELEQPDDFKKGGSVPKLPKKKNAKAWSRSIEATNRLFTKNPLFEQPKSRKNKVYDPKAKYYQDGGELPDDYQEFLDYSATAPENRQPGPDYFYGNPDDYDHYGMWDALGKPKNFEEALQMNPDWTPDEYDGMYHGFSVNPNTGVFLKAGKPGGIKEGDTTWMEIAGHYLSPRAQVDTPVFDIDLQRFKYIPNKQNGGSKLGPILLNSGRFAAKKYPFGKFSGVFKKQEGGEPEYNNLPPTYLTALRNFIYPNVVADPRRTGHNALTNTISYDPESPIENVNNDWWMEHELFHELQNQAGGLSTSGIVGERPNQYVASDQAIQSYYDRRDADVNRVVDQMIAENPELQFIPRERLIEGSPAFVGAESLQYGDPTTLEGEARQYEQYIEAGNPSIFPQGPDNYVELELTPEEIDQYAKGGYIVEDISVPSLTRFQKGGKKKKKLNRDNYKYYKHPSAPGRTFAKDSKGNWKEVVNNELREIGYDPNYYLTPHVKELTEEEKKIALSPGMSQYNPKDLKEVQIKRQPTQMELYLKEYEDMNGYDSYMSNRAERYFKNSAYPGLDRAFGYRDLESLSQKIKDKWTAEYNRNKNTYATERYLRDYLGVDPDKRGQWVDKVSDTSSYEGKKILRTIANSEYGYKLKPNLFARFVGGLTETLNWINPINAAQNAYEYVTGTDYYNPTEIGNVLPDYLSEKEFEEITPLDVFAPAEYIPRVILNSTIEALDPNTDVSLNTISGYRNPNIRDEDEAVANIVSGVVQAPALVASLPSMVKSGANVAKKLLSSTDDAGKLIAQTENVAEAASDVRALNKVDELPGSVNSNAGVSNIKVQSNATPTNGSPGVLNSVSKTVSEKPVITTNNTTTFTNSEDYLNDLMTKYPISEEEAVKFIQEYSKTVGDPYQAYNMLGHGFVGSTKTAGSDIQKLATALKYNAKAPVGEYLYHGTSSSNLDNILKNGLDNSLGAPTNTGGTMPDVLGAGQTTATGDLNYAKNFSDISSQSSGGNPVLIRFKNTEGLDVGYIGANKAVPAKEIEYSLDGGNTWVKSDALDNTTSTIKSDGTAVVDNKTPTFKSEIDWAKWNPDTPKYPELINEYNAIEESTKKAGTWMKNPDGSTFQGTPEQFVQQQSSWFKKAFGESKLIGPEGSPMFLYHGSAKKFDTFDPSKFQLGDAGYSGAGIYTTPSKTTANSYATSSAKFHSGDIEPTVYQLYGQGNRPIKSSDLIKENQGRDLFNFYRDRNWKGELSPYESLREYDVAVSDQLPNVQNIRPLYDAREIVFPTNTQLKSAVGNVGFFDMTNPNIYKSVLPYIIGTGAAGTLLNSNEQTVSPSYQEEVPGFKRGGSIVLELTDKEIEEYKRKGYIVEEY